MKQTIYLIQYNPHGEIVAQPINPNGTENGRPLVSSAVEELALQLEHPCAVKSYRGYRARCVGSYNNTCALINDALDRRI